MPCFRANRGLHANPANKRRHGLHDRHNDRDRHGCGRVVRFEDWRRRHIVIDEWSVRRYAHLDCGGSRRFVDIIKWVNRRRFVQFDVLRFRFRFERRRRWRGRWIGVFQQFLDDRTRRDECSRPVA